MVNVLRRWSQPIMVIITVLVIVSFLYFGPGMKTGNAGKQVVVTLFGQGITVEDMQRQSRRVGIFQALNGDYIRAIASGEAELATVARSFVLEHEADQLGISSTQDERFDALNSMPIFHGEDGKFDPDKFQAFKNNVLSPNGFSDGDFEQIFLAGEVRARKLREIVGGLVSVSKSEVREQIVKERQKTETSYVAFRRADFLKDIKPTEEELKKRYDEQKDTLKTPEQGS